MQLNPAWRDQKKGCRDGFGEALVELGKHSSRVVVLTADLSESTRTHLFAREFPERFINVGVAEQNMMGIAAGLAQSGKIPFITSYGVFSPGRNWDQLRVSVCYSQLNVKVISTHSGLSVGPDGATHQSLEDIAITRVLPHLTVVAPCDYYETKKATLALADFSGPAYMRFSRDNTSVMTLPETPFNLEKSYHLKEGKDVTLVGCGSLLSSALAASEILAKEGISVEIINAHCIKPFDRDMLLNSVKKTGCAVTLEDHQRVGGLGSLVCEEVSSYHPVPVVRMGVADSFGESGAPQELYDKYHLSVKDIIKAVKKVFLAKSTLRERFAIK